MELPIHQLIEEIKARKVFGRNKRRVELKILVEEDEQIFIWSAIDVDTKECLSRQKIKLPRLFLKEVLKYCENKPEILQQSSSSLSFQYKQPCSP